MLRSTRRRKNKVGATGKQGGSAATTSAGVWSAADDAALQHLLGPLQQPPKIDFFGMIGSEARGLICAPKSEVYDRVMR